MRRLLLFLLFSAVAFAQTTVPPPSSWAEFVEVGVQSSQNIVGGIGVAATIAPSTQVFGEVTAATGQNSSQTTNIILGVKTNLPKVRTFTPFTIVGYGGAITSVLKLTTLPAGVTGLNAASVAAFGTAAGFAQEYAAGAEHPLGKSGFNIGVGGIVNKNTTSAWKGYPFVFISKVF